MMDDERTEFEEQMAQFTFRASGPQPVGDVMFLTRQRVVASGLPDDVIKGECGKKAFDGKKDATTAANRLTKRGQGEIKAYHCRVCKGDVWHVSSSSKNSPTYPDKKKRLERRMRNQQRERDIDKE